MIEQGRLLTSAPSQHLRTVLHTTLSIERRAPTGALKKGGLQISDMIPVQLSLLWYFYIIFLIKFR